MIALTLKSRSEIGPGQCMDSPVYRCCSCNHCLRIQVLSRQGVPGGDSCLPSLASMNPNSIQPPWEGLTGLLSSRIGGYGKGTRAFTAMTVELPWAVVQPRYKLHGISCYMTCLAGRTEVCGSQRGKHHIQSLGLMSPMLIIPISMQAWDGDEIASQNWGQVTEDGLSSFSTSNSLLVLTMQRSGH